MLLISTINTSIPKTPPPTHIRNVIVNLVCNSKAVIKRKITEELKIYLAGKDNGSGF